MIPTGPPTCTPEEYPPGFDRILIENNRASGQSFISFTLNGVSHSSVNDNLFLNESFLGAAGSLNDGIIINGISIIGGCQFIIPYGKGNSINNNSFPNDLHFVTVSQEDIRITGNTMIMKNNGIAPNSLAIALRGTNGGVVTNNYIESTVPAVGMGIYTDSRVPAPPWPFDYTNNLNIRDNTIVNVGIGIVAFGGLEKSSISGNTISGSGVFGIAVLDNADGLYGAGQQNNPSSNFTLSKNAINAQNVAGILLNGDTSGVSVVNNTFGDSDSVLVDIVLADTDLLYGIPT